MFLFNTNSVSFNFQMALIRMTKTMRMPWTKMQSSSSDLFLILAALTVLGLNLSLHHLLCRPPPSPTMSPHGPRQGRCIYGMSGPFSSPSTYLATPTTKNAQTPPYLRSHLTAAPRVSRWTGLRPVMPIHRRSGYLPETSTPRFT